MSVRLRRRRALVHALGAALLATAPWPSFGQGNGADAPDKAGARKGAVLTVVVTGNGKPVDQAEVKVKLASRAGSEATIPTDQRGEAVFKLSATGAATVRVIATGWESLLKEVLLKEGRHKLPLELKSLEGAK